MKGSGISTHWGGFRFLVSPAVEVLTPKFVHSKKGVDLVRFVADLGPFQERSHHSPGASILHRCGILAGYRGSKGLVQKVWFSDERIGVFGAFYLWEKREGLEKEVSTMYRIEARTGIKPAVRRFEVEAIQEGNHQVERLLQQGKTWAADRDE